MKDLDVLESKMKSRTKNFDEKYALAKLRLEIALQISQAREKAGLTQKELAVKLRTTQSVVSRIESGNQNLSLDMLYKIAEAVGKKRVSVMFG